MAALVVAGAIGFLAMCVAAGLLEAIGPNRIARLLRLPPDDYR